MSADASRSSCGYRRNEIEPGPNFLRETGRLLSDLYFTRRAVGAHLDGQIALDPRLGEDLLGKTWRAEDLEPVADLELVEVGYARVDDGEFDIETSYLTDVPTGAIYAERQKWGPTMTVLERRRMIGA